MSHYKLYGIKLTFLDGQLNTVRQYTYAHLHAVDFLTFFFQTVERCSPLYRTYV